MKVLWRLRSYPLRYKRRTAIAYLCTVLSIVAAMFVPALLGAAIDEALSEGGLGRQQLWLAAGIVGASAVRGVFGYGQNYLIYSVTEKVSHDLRNDIFNTLLGLSFGFYDRQRTGDLMSRTTTDVTVLQSVMTLGPLRLLTMSAMLVTVSAIVLWTNWRLGLVVVAFLTLYLARALSRKGLGEIYAQLQAETGRLTAVLHENIVGMRVVKVFGAQRLESAKFDEGASTVADLGYSAQRYWAVRRATFTFLTTLTVGLILWLGGREVFAGRTTPGEIVSFLAYIGLVAGPIGYAVNWILNMSRAAAAGERILEMLDAESPAAAQRDARKMTNVRGHVKFEGVSIRYDSRAEALTDVSFEVEPGQMVALLGPPGSGKSTVAHLIPRFYDVSSGRVTVDGADVRDADLSSLRRNVGIVLQDVFVFAATFKENIAYGARDATMDEIIRAAKAAQLHDFIDALPDKYDSWVGERGVKLSGGQRQRLAIARTLLLDPPILILDDSTSSVDVETEHRIQEALSEVVRGRTTFVVAHRLSSVRGADRILVLDRGRLMESGSHAELYKRGGLYRTIYDLQLTPSVEDAWSQASTAADGGTSK